MLDSTPEFVAILLCAGRGTRFDPAGQQDKLLQVLANGSTVAGQSARMLKSVLPRVLAVVRPGRPALVQVLQTEGCEVVVCEDAAIGMSASLRQGLLCTADAAGWLVALADMPFVDPATARALLGALRQGHGIVVPEYEGRRGNPVGFDRRHLPALLQLEGDAGARALLASPDACRIAVPDPGIHRDIDRPQDLAAT
jgi:molybdenum cofactor cytidylyltransferase